MKRTQIYFPKSLHQDLEIGAAMTKVSLSEFIRMILEEKLYTKSIKKRASFKKRAKPSIIAESAVSLGKKNLAKNFDKYFEASLK